MIKGSTPFRMPVEMGSPLLPGKGQPTGFTTMDADRPATDDGFYKEPVRFGLLCLTGDGIRYTNRPLHPGP